MIVSGNLGSLLGLEPQPHPGRSPGEQPELGISEPGGNSGEDL